MAVIRQTAEQDYWTHDAQVAAIARMEAQRHDPGLKECTDCNEIIAFVTNPKTGRKIALNCLESEESNLPQNLQERYGHTNDVGELVPANLIAAIEVPRIEQVEVGKMPIWNMAKWGSHNFPSQFVQDATAGSPNAIKPCPGSRNRRDAAQPQAETTPNDYDTERVVADTTQASETPEYENRQILGDEVSLQERENLADNQIDTDAPVKIKKK